MENAVDALKIAFALLVFAIAITLTLSVVGQAKATADAVFVSTDKTAFYTYTTAGDYNAEEYRTVGFETILPTIHRYAKEQYAVTIFDTNGTPIARYDLYTEGFMANWNETIKNLKSPNDSIKEKAVQTYKEVEERLQQVQDVVNNYLKSKGTLTEDIEIMDYIGTETTIYNSNLLYSGSANTSKDITVVSPWVGEPDTDTVERIRADLGGTDYVKNYNGTNITYKGKNLNQYKDRTFTEMFLEITTSNDRWKTYRWKRLD
jgi:hypothetical protein